MCSPCAEPHVTADLPSRLERANSLPELSRIGFGAAFLWPVAGFPLRLGLSPLPNRGFQRRASLWAPPTASRAYARRLQQRLPSSSPTWRRSRPFRLPLLSRFLRSFGAFEFPQKRLCFTFDELYCLTHSIAGFPIALSTSLRFGLVAKFSRLLL
jgi:hypothetical protein